MFRRSLATALFMMLPSLVAAQDPRAAATAAAIARARAAMAPLAALAGQWEGDASAMMGPGRTVRIKQSEDITWGSNGTVLIIKGTGHGTEGATAGQIVFEATAVVWFDPEAGRVRMMTHREGPSVEPTLEFKPDTLIGGFPVAGGRIKYTITYTNDTWHEVGEFLRDGASPFVTIDMRLKKRSR